jgi:hypothetical protein
MSRTPLLQRLGRPARVHHRRHGHRRMRRRSRWRPSSSGIASPTGRFPTICSPGTNPRRSGTRRKPPISSPTRRICSSTPPIVCAASLAAGAMLEQTPGIAFHTDRVLFRINDRLLAPNTVETFKSVEPELNTFFSTLLGGAVKLEHLPAVDRPFEVAIQGSATSASLGSLRSRIK